MIPVYKIKEEGTYVDLSRITSISSIHNIDKSSYHPTIAFTITYIPDGIPFKNDNINHLTIFKELPVPEHIRVKYKDIKYKDMYYTYSDEGVAKIEEYRKEETEKFEKIRKELAHNWSLYKQVEGR